MPKRVTNNKRSHKKHILYTHTHTHTHTMLIFVVKITRQYEKV